MKKATKILSAAAITLASVGIATTAVFAWGDNSGLKDGRPVYTIKQIEDGALDGKAVMNSISDPKALTGEGVLEDERYFVGVRDASTGNNGAKNLWNNDYIEVEEGKEYIVRIYVHNNNAWGKEEKGSKNYSKRKDALDVTTRFSLGKTPDTTQRIDGYINSSNAFPTKIWDSVELKSKDGRKFYLDYIEGSALLENNGIGSAKNNGGTSGYKLTDDIISKDVMIGFDKLDGVIRGCFYYSSYVTIRVKPVFEDSSIQKTVRVKGTKEWTETVDAKIGDQVEFQIHYKNLNASKVSNVIIRDSLPDGLEYVPNSTVLYNTTYPNGATTTDNTLVIDGVNIGSYNVKGDAYVRFTANVVDKNIVCGNNRLINWAKASANGFAVQDSASVYVKKTCAEEPKKVSYKVTFIDCDNKSTVKTVEVAKAGDSVEVVSPWNTKHTISKDATIRQTNCDEKKDTPKELPSTGAASIATGVIGLGSVVTAAGYYVASRKENR